MRIRTIKPEFFKHDGMALLPPLTRLLFQGLWCLADCEGRLEDRPARIKVEVLPYDKCDVDAMLAELQRGGFIIRYAADGLQLIQVLSFKRHQRITGKEAETPSRFPEWNGETTGKHWGNNGETPETTGNGRETEGNRKGREGNGDIYSPECRAALHYLNQKTGKAFREVETNLAVIHARLREHDVTIDGVRQMIDRQCALWKGSEMEEYLRPQTLFGKEKFDGYYAARLVPLPNAKPRNEPDRGEIKEGIKIRIIPT